MITVSDGIAERLQERYRLPVTPTVVRNVSALCSAAAAACAARLGVDPEAPLVLHQGAPAPGRGCEQLVAAAARLDGVRARVPRRSGARLRRGAGAEIRARGLGERVSLLPSVPLDELLAYTAEADVGVTLLQDTCENHRLALPNKLFEYIAAGVPVVASALPETERVIRAYGVGWCVAPDDPEAVASTLSRAIAERDDVALRGRLAYGASQLCWAREQTRLIELYAALDGGLR